MNEQTIMEIKKAEAKYNRRVAINKDAVVLVECSENSTDEGE